MTDYPECSCGPSAPYGSHEPTCPRDEGNLAQRTWTDWLASIGYGVDFSTEAPPCTRRELAEAYVRVTGEEDADTWEWCIAENTGALTPEPSP